MSFLSSIAKSVVRGGLLKSAGKSAIRGLKSSGAKIAKGLKRGGVRVIRGIKSGSAQARALPKAVSDAVKLAQRLPKDFGTRNTLQVIKNSISRDLARASKTALAKDAQERLAKTFTKIATQTKMSESLKNILKNARANETWGQYALRMGRNAGNLTNRIIREGGENVVIDKSAQSIAKAIGGLTSAGVAGAVTAKLTEKKD